MATATYSSRWITDDPNKDRLVPLSSLAAADGVEVFTETIRDIITGQWYPGGYLSEFEVSFYATDINESQGVHVLAAFTHPTGTSLTGGDRPIDLVTRDREGYLWGYAPVFPRGANSTGGGGVAYEMSARLRLPKRYFSNGDRISVWFYNGGIAAFSAFAAYGILVHGKVLPR